MITYSPDRRVSEAVAMLIASFERNPYAQGHATVAEITDIITEVYGRKAAKSIRITVH
jgi:hypothetical protein